MTSRLTGRGPGLEGTRPGACLAGASEVVAHAYCDGRYAQARDRDDGHICVEVTGTVGAVGIVVDLGIKGVDLGFLRDVVVVRERPLLGAVVARVAACAAADPVIARAEVDMEFVLAYRHHGGNANIIARCVAAGEHLAFRALDQRADYERLEVIQAADGIGLVVVRHHRHARSIEISRSLRVGVRRRDVQRTPVVRADEAQVARLRFAGKPLYAEQRMRYVHGERAAELRAGVPDRVVHEALVAEYRGREQGIRGRAGVVVVHADVVVVGVVHRADGAAQANGAVAARQAGVAVAARQLADALVQPDPALHLEQPRQAAAQVLVAANAYTRAV